MTRSPRIDVTELETYSGHFVNYLDPDPAHIELVDIARGLSQTCRFAGQTTQYYSVAEHAVYVSHLVEDDAVALAALHHDSHEAYIGDWPSPLKYVLGGDAYQQIKRNLDIAIGCKFRIPVGDFSSPLVKQADIEALRHEAATLKWSHGTGPHWGWDDAVTPMAGIGWSPSKAEREFIKRHYELEGWCC